MKVQNAKINYSRIFLRQLKLFREYMDFRLYDTRFIDFNNNKYYSGWLLSLFVDFKDRATEGNGDITWYCRDPISCYNCTDIDQSCGLYYQTYEPNIGSQNNSLRTFMRNSIDVSYTTVPDIYILKLCKGGQLGGNKDDCTGESGDFNYLSTSTYFYPTSTNISNGKRLLNLDSLQPTNDCEGNCRLPDVPEYTYKSGYCLFKPGQNNLLSCGSTYETKILNVVQDILKYILNVLKMI